MNLSLFANFSGNPLAGLAIMGGVVAAALLAFAGLIWGGFWLAKRLRAKSPWDQWEGKP